MRNHRILFISVFSFFLVLTLVFTGYWCFFSSFSSSKEHSYIYIDRNDNIDSVFIKLENGGHPRQMLGFTLLSKFHQYEKNIKTGKYETGNGVTTINLIKNLIYKHQVPVNLIVPSVRTLEKLSSKLAKMIEPDSAELMDYFRDSTTYRQFNCSQATLPSLIIPNTYEVYWDITPEQLLKRLEKEYKIFWNQIRLDKARAKGLNPTEVMTLASIVDQETANNGEKPAIAGMYLNRLRKNMLLQADPTVKFASRQFGLRRILHKHLKIDSPYNTYLYKGLPPGPISIPAISSIEAVLNAEQNNYLYMCAKEDFSGTHNFASSYTQHLRNARKYTQALNRRGIK